MNIKKGIIVGSIALAATLPLSTNAQKTVNKTKKNLIETVDDYEGIDQLIVNNPEYQKQTFDHINEIRNQYNLPNLKYDKSLENLAMEQSKYLKESKPIGHHLTWEDHSNGSNETPTDRIKKNRGERLDRMGTRQRTGECIVTINFNSIKKVVNVRMLSEDGHKEQLLGPYTHMGIAYKEGSNYLIVVFAR